MLTEISRFQNLAIITYNVNEATINGQQGSIDVGRGCKDNIKTSFAPGRNCELRYGKVRNSLAKFRLENGIQPHPVDWVHGHTGRARFVADGIGNWSRTAVGDGDGVLTSEVVCVIETDGRR